MFLSLNWLKDYIQLDVPVDALCDRMIMLGMKIESVARPGDEIQNVRIGCIVSIERHPDADKLSVCRTDVGEGEPLTIVCGAQNMKVGDKVPTAMIGGQLPGGFAIGKRKMRGVESQGMMCSSKELGLGDDHDGLLILGQDTPIGADVKPLLGLDDVILEIEVIPNRGDWASYIGVARELAASYALPFVTPKPALKKSSTRTSELTSITVEDSGLCPRYVGRVIQGVKIGPSPDWLKRRLIAVGQRPVNNVVDITNYVLLETGHPLHAFDYERLAEHRIVVRRARAGEEIKVIDQTVQKLKPEMLVIADAKQPVAIAGVMGGFDSEVGETTTNILLESAYFNPISIRRTSRALGIATEASQRFQRGADPEIALHAANRACQLILEIAGGTLAAESIDQYPNPIPAKEIVLRYARTEHMLGTPIEPSTQRKYLEAIGFQPIEHTPETLKVAVPSWRYDCDQEVDLIEEVARLHDFENIPQNIPKVRHTDGEFDSQYPLIKKIRNYLVGIGLTEVMNWTFCSPENVRKLHLDPSYLDMVMVANPLTENHNAMRTSLLPGLLNTVSYNIRHTNRDLALFEIGPVYKPSDDNELPTQYLRLALACTGAAEDRNWGRPNRETDIYDLKGMVEALGQELGARFTATPADTPHLAAGQSAAISFNLNHLGSLGALGAGARKAFDLNQHVFLAELDLEPLVAHATPWTQFAELPQYPASLRDIAVVVDKHLPAGDLVATAEAAGGKILKRVEVFDLYHGSQLAPDKKSIALNLVFQSHEKTLTDADTQKSVDRIVKKLQENHKITLR